MDNTETISAPSISRTHTHETAPTQYLKLDGVRHGYRVFGKPSAVPLVLLQHMTGTMDGWDPAVTNALAQQRLLILFDNTGVGSSDGQVPLTIAQMASTAQALIAKLGYKLVDLLGLSIGGFIAQELAIHHPALVRKMILVGTGPRGQTANPTVDSLEACKGKEMAEQLLYLFYEKSEASRALGQASLQRLQARTRDRTPLTSPQSINLQVAAIVNWGNEVDPEFFHLRSIKQPVLVVNGSNDIMVPTVNSWLLFQHLPQAQLSLYPDSGHGSLFQYPALFVEQVAYFLKQK